MSFAEWLAERVRTDRSRERLCAYGTRPGETSEPRCTVVIDPDVARAHGHPGYCSAEHDALAQEDAPM